MIDLVDEDPDIVARMLVFLYNPLYYPSLANWSESHSAKVAVFHEAKRRLALLVPDDRSGVSKLLPDALTVHAKLHGLSKKYDIPDLTRMSCERFVEFVVHLIDLDLDFTEYSEHAGDFIDAIKIVYGSEQESDLIMREAAVYLARVYVKTVKKGGNYNDEAKENLQAFREVFLVAEFAWHMTILNFKNARFTCEYCEDKFRVPEEYGSTAGCKCSERGLCGKCVPISGIQCPQCLQKGACRLIEQNWIKGKRTKPVSSSG